MIREEGQSSNPLMNSMISTLILNGGKRIRPLILMTVFRGLDGAEEAVQQAYHAGASLELIHTATLIHDDLIDQSKLRRGAPTIYAQHGIPPAVLAGDYLFVVAYALASTLPKNLVQKIITDLRHMAEGQLLEEMINPKTLTFTEYLNIITSKTAMLFRSACVSGAFLAGASESMQQVLSDAGLMLGIAFQLIDDMLDVMGNENITGKPIGADFLADKMTLPYLLYEEHFGDLPQERTQETFQAIYADLTSELVMLQAKRLAKEKTKNAQKGFSVLTNASIRTFILEICDKMLSRIL
ncbi:MAG: polyprenyl synthetase family protein [Candidatus Marinimicrobia bacterium]|nr:polyprenyl synthetase family protein [Candidatus Neomarinimicrobiota bacterium]MDD5582723.1 polyprenyl synthetase family protein [Candidatus Neomarinimicrobiota bacterium]